MNEGVIKDSLLSHHDTFLIANLYQGVTGFCLQHSTFKHEAVFSYIFGSDISIKLGIIGCQCRPVAYIPNSSYLRICLMINPIIQIPQLVQSFTCFALPDEFNHFQFSFLIFLPFLQRYIKWSGISQKFVLMNSICVLGSCSRSNYSYFIFALFNV